MTGTNFTDVTASRCAYVYGSINSPQTNPAAAISTEPGIFATVTVPFRPPDRIRQSHNQSVVLSWNSQAGASYEWKQSRDLNQGNGRRQQPIQAAGGPALVVDHQFKLHRLYRREALKSNVNL